MAKGGVVDTSEDNWEDESMDDSDDSDGGGKQGKKVLIKTENEKFFEDL